MNNAQIYTRNLYVYPSIECTNLILPQLLQQHINRSVRRLARMTGNAVPTDEVLRRNLEKRVATLADDPLFKRYNPYVPPALNEKRYNRAGTGRVQAVSPVSLHRGHHHHGGNGNNNGSVIPHFPRHHSLVKFTVQRSGNGAGTSTNDTATTVDSATVVATAVDSTTIVLGSATAAASGAAATASGAAGSDDNTADSVTAANQPSTANSLGLDIE